MITKPRFHALGRNLIQTLAATTLFGTVAHAQNLLDTANPGFESNFGFFGPAADQGGVTAWFSTRNDDWFWISSGDGQGNPRSGGATARLSNSALSTLASSRPTAIPGQGYTFRIWVNDVATWTQNTGTIRLQFFDNNSDYIPVSVGEFTQNISPPDRDDSLPGLGYQQFTVSGFAPANATHVGVFVESFGYALNSDDAELVEDNTLTPAAVLVSEDLNFTGGTVVVGDVGSARIDPNGAFVFQLDGNPLTPAVSKVGGVTTVAFTSPIADNLNYNYSLQVPLIGGGTQNFSGDIRSYYIPQTLPGTAGGPGTWGIREYGAIAGNLTESATIAKAGTDSFVEATRPVFNATDQDALNPRQLGNFNNDIAIVSEAPGNQDWVVVGKTVVSIPAPGIYTFSVHSDDGFAMRVGGAGGGRFLRTHGAGAIDAADETTIFYDQGTADSNTRGVYRFDSAGNYDITYLGWDGGGNGYYEVAWAAGEFAFERETNTWALVGNPSNPLVTGQPFRLLYPANLPGPAGSTSAFGVRTYLNVTPLNNLDDAMNFLATTTRQPDGVETFDNTVTTINHRDPEDGGEGIFPGDTPFPGNTEAQENGVITVHKGRVRVAIAGDYTFLGNGDDGFFLRIKGVNGNPNPAFRAASQGANNADGRFTMSNRNELFFSGGTGAANTRGVIPLTAGEYDIEFVHFEVNGGFFYELGVAYGAYLHGTSPPAGFRLVGDVPATTVVGLPGIADPGWTVESSTPDRPEFNFSIAGAEAAINATLADGTAPAAKVSTWDTINFLDPEAGQAGGFTPNNTWPLNTSGADDNYAMRATATLTISAPGNYILGYQGDDGGYMTIEGPGNPQWNAIVFSNHPAEAMIVEDTAGSGIFNRMQTEVGSGDSRTLGRVNLAAGSYTLRTLVYEGGGGSWWEVIGGSDTGSYSGAGASVPLLSRGAPQTVVDTGLALVRATAGNLGIAAFTTTGNPVSSVGLTFSSQDNLTYGIEASTTLVGWTVVASGIDGQAGSTASTVNISAFPAFFGQPRVFFRVFEE